MPKFPTMLIVIFFSAFWLKACSQTDFQASPKRSVADDKEQEKKSKKNPSKSRGKTDDPDKTDSSDNGEDDDKEKVDQDGDQDVDIDLGEKKEEFPTGDDVQIDSSVLTSTPGQVVDVIGVHFEDGSDNDFNDLSVCFKGKFKVDGTKIVSIGKQTITLTAKRISGAAHTYSIKVNKSDGTNIDVFSGTPEKNVEVEHKSKIFGGSRLTVETTPAKSAVLTMNTANRVRVELNLCRNTGI